MQKILLVCLIFFLISLCFLERLSSIKIFIKLALNFLIFYGYIKAISIGKSIVLCTLLLVFSFSLVNIFIKNGIHKKSFSEWFSVLIITFLTGFSVWIVCKIVNPNLYENEIMLFNGIKKSENAIFGIYIIITLGIFMDIISRIIYRLDEKKDKTVDVPWLEQFKQGISIGKEYISEKINLIILILLSFSLFPICENINKGVSLFEICGQSVIFVYLLIALVQSIGLIFSVIITSGIYSCFNRKKTIYKTVSENKVDGKRSLKL